MISIPRKVFLYISGMLALAVVAACSLSVSATIKFETLPNSHNNIVGEVSKLILDLGFNAGKFFGKHETRKVKDHEQTGFVFNERGNLNIILESNDAENEVKIILLESNKTHDFTDLAIEKYRALVNGVQEISGIRNFVADEKTSRGQALLMR